MINKKRRKIRKVKSRVNISIIRGAVIGGTLPSVSGAGGVLAGAFVGGQIGRFQEKRRRILQSGKRLSKDRRSRKPFK